jgi:hypothetical protein
MAAHERSRLIIGYHIAISKLITMMNSIRARGDKLHVVYNVLVFNEHNYRAFSFTFIADFVLGRKKDVLSLEV